ncbi:putative Nucleolar GTP-binding protein, partial [Danaus plexippus plexippus]
ADTNSELRTVPIMRMSTMTEEGVQEVKIEACERLLGHRVTEKMRTKKVDGILNRLHVSMPSPRDGRSRPPVLPPQVVAKKEKQLQRETRKRKLEREIEVELGDDYVLDLKKNYTDIPEEERYDPIPEFWEGHNIADYIDPEIFEKLAQLEKEEELREQGGMYEAPKIEYDETMREIRQLAVQIRNKKAVLKDESRLVKQSTKPVMPRNTRAREKTRSTKKLRDEMEQLALRHRFDTPGVRAVPRGHSAPDEVEGGIKHIPPEPDSGAILSAMLAAILAFVESTLTYMIQSSNQLPIMYYT